MLKVFKKKWFWITVISVLVVGGFYGYYAAAKSVDAKVEKITKGAVRQYLEDTGTVKSHNSQTVYVESTGKVKDINVDVGDVVKQGDLLLSLDKADLELQLKDAESRIDAAKAQVKGTEIINYANKIEIAKAAVEQARISFETARRNLENARELYNTNVMSKDEFERIQDAYKAASAALNAANLQLEETRRGTPESVKDGYRAQLEQAVISRDSILRSIQKMEIKSPIDGVVLERPIEKNTYAVPGTPAFIIGDNKSLEIDADILADDAVKVKTGNEVEISGKAAGEAALKGKVVKVAPAAKNVVSSLGVNQKRVPVKIELIGNYGSLKPGVNIDIKIITAEKEDVLSVPDTAVFDYKGGNYVFAVENGKAVLKPVKKGIESGGRIEIQEGLKEGDVIIVSPDNAVKEGMRIRS